MAGCSEPDKACRAAVQMCNSVNEHMDIANHGCHIRHSCTLLALSILHFSFNNSAVATFSCSSPPEEYWWLLAVTAAYTY